MEAGEASRIERYLRQKFNNNTLKAKPRSDDVAESSADTYMDWDVVAEIS